MKNKIVLFIVAGLGIFIFQKYILNSDEKQINKIINDLEESLEYKGTIPPLSIVSRIKTIQSVLAPDFTAKSIQEGKIKELDNIDSIKESAFMASRYFSEIDIFKIPFIVKVNGRTATASFNITVSGQDISKVTFKELIHLEMEFIKTENNWLCSSISAERLTPE